MLIVSFVAARMKAWKVHENVMKNATAITYWLRFGNSMPREKGQKTNTVPLKCSRYQSNNIALQNKELLTIVSQNS